MTPLAIARFSARPRRPRNHPAAPIVATLWLCAIVALPLGAVVVTSFTHGPAAFFAAITSADATSSIALTLWTSALVAAIDVVFGVALALVLVRAELRGMSIVDALIELPFALPTLVPGIALLRIVGAHSGIAFARPSIVLVLLFVTLPFVVRAVEPVLRAVDVAEEEAATTLGATTTTTFVRVLLPALIPSITGGALQAFARAVAEFGSVVVVSGNIPGETLIAPALVYREVESGRLDVAASISVVLLAIAALALAARSRIVRHA